MKLNEWLKQSTSKLSTSGINSARLDALLILEDILKKPRSWILAHPEHEIDIDKLKSLDKKIMLRSSNQPLAYILGSKEFYGRTFQITKDVLIPRPETESFIQLLKKIVESYEVNTIFDIGTGSGILAITAKLEFPDIHVSASDISASALKVAKINANSLGANIRFFNSNLFASLPKMPKTRKYIVLANLPYVPNKLITSKEILNEPKLAIFSGSDGLDLYKQFWSQVKELNNKPFCIMVESLVSQHKKMQSLAKDAGYTLNNSEILVQVFFNSNNN